MFWAIVLIGSGITAPGVVYIGQFEQQEACLVAMKDLQRQTLKGTCVQIQKAAVPPVEAQKK